MSAYWGQDPLTSKQREFGGGAGDGGGGSSMWVLVYSQDFTISGDGEAKQVAADSSAIARGVLPIHDHHPGSQIEVSPQLGSHQATMHFPS